MNRENVSSERLAQLFRIDRDELWADSPEAAEMSRALWRHDERHDGEFTALRRLYDSVGDLRIDPPADGLTPAQVQALDILRAVDQLAKEVESRYRKWLIDGTTKLRPAIGRKKAWAVLRAAGEYRLVELGDRLRANESMRVVQHHHERLAASRGTVPWSRRAVATGTVVPKFEPIETRLDSLAGLYRENFVEPEAWE